MDRLAWKKNTQHLYDTLCVYELSWPSRSIAWVPEVITKLGHTKQRLVLSADTINESPEYLHILELRIPEIDSTQIIGHQENDGGAIGGYMSSFSCDLHLIQLIDAKGRVEQARLIPQNPNLVATISRNGNNAVFDLTKFPTRPMNFYKPTIDLKTSRAVSSSIDCSPVIEGDIAIGCEEGKIDLFNLEAYFNPRNSQMEPQFSLMHADSISDVKWHPKRPKVLASCGNDGYLRIWNTSSMTGGTILELQLAEIKKVDNTNNNSDTVPKIPTCLAWNPVNESLLAIGYQTGDVELWDVRRSGTLLFSFQGHTSKVTRVVFNTWHPGVLATSSLDTTVKIWDAAELRYEPLFCHKGHSGPVTDVQWNPAVPHMLASVSENKDLHVYAPSDDLLGF